MELSVSFGLRRALAILRHDRGVARASRGIPKPVPWDWAERRILPLLAGPYIGGDPPLVAGRSDLGCALFYGFPLGPGFGLVDEIVAERWERTVDQLHSQALANLATRAARLGPEIVTRATLGGRIVRTTDRRPTWATSLLLVPDELKRLFGSHDQLFVTPSWERLMSFDPDVPTLAMAHIAVDFEGSARYPLMLDPFALVDGKVEWCPEIDPDDDDWP
jgi:hypothetical protein